MFKRHWDLIINIELHNNVLRVANLVLNFLRWNGASNLNLFWDADIKIPCGRMIWV